MTTKQATEFPIPDWIPPDSWAGFCEMRREIKAPLTDRGIAIIVKRLSDLRQQGFEAGEVLDQSTMNAWRSVFAIHEERRGNGHRKQSIIDIIRDSARTPNFD